MKEHGALAHVAKWTECRPVNRKVTDSFPSQSTSLGCGPDPQLGVCERQLINGSLAHLAQCISSSLPPSIPLSLKINKILKKKKNGYDCAQSNFIYEYRWPAGFGRQAVVCWLLRPPCQHTIGSPDIVSLPCLKNVLPRAYLCTNSYVIGIPYGLLVSIILFIY